MMLKDNECTKNFGKGSLNFKTELKKMGSCEVLAGCSWLSKLGKMDGR